MSNSLSVPIGSSGPVKYTLNVANGTGGGSYAAGTVVSIVANAPPAGQSFQNWTGASVANANAAATTLGMPVGATSVTANYAAIPAPTITSINRASVPIGTFNLTITGTGFQANAQTTLGAKALATNHVSGTRLTASEFNSTSGTSNLVVSNGTVGCRECAGDNQRGPALSTTSGFRPDLRRCGECAPISTKRGGTYGLNPNMPELAALYTAGRAAILANVGMLVIPLVDKTAYGQYQPGSPNLPVNLFSHSDQSSQWQTAQPNGLGSTGWGGRAADAVQASYDSAGQYPSVVNNGGFGPF